MKLKKKWVITIPIIVAISILIGLYYYFNRVDKNSFTVSDRKWIEEHQSNVIDFEIMNDYPIFGESGVFRNFINEFSDDTGLEFNIIQYFKESKPDSNGYRFRALKLEENLKDNDLLLQEDIYILFGKDNGRINNINDLGSKTIGVLATDSDEIFYYLKSYTLLKYKTYDKSDDLFNEYENGTIDMIIIPSTMYLN